MVKSPMVDWPSIFFCHGYNREPFSMRRHAEQDRDEWKDFLRVENNGCDLTQIIMPRLNNKLNIRSLYSSSFWINRHLLSEVLTVFKWLTVCRVNDNFFFRFTGQKCKYNEVNQTISWSPSPSGIGGSRFQRARKWAQKFR